MKRRERPSFWLLLSLLSSLWPATIACGEEIRGSEQIAWGTRPVIHHSIEEYGGNAQVWMTASDADGFLYFTELQSLVQYDGTRWRHFPLSTAKYVAVDGRNRVHVLGRRTFGYFEREYGQMRYTSLLDHLSESQKQVVEGRSITVLGSKVLYCTDRWLYELDEEGELGVRFESESESLRGIFEWQGRFYLFDLEKGLLRVDSEALVPVPGTEIFGAMALAALVPWDSDSALVLTSTEGAFLLREGQAPEPFPLVDDAFLRQNEISHAISTSEGQLLVTTLRGGAVILDRRGRILSIFDRERHPQINNSVYFAFEDPQGNFWLSTDAGIVRIPRLSFRLAIDPSSIDGSLHRIHRHQGELYVATRTHLYNPKSEIGGDGPHGTELDWQPVEGADGGTWFLLSEGDDLLAATSDGTFVIRGRGEEKKAEQVCPGLSVSLYRSEHLPGRVFSATAQGLKPLYREGDTWRCGETIAGLDGYIYEMVDGPDGELVLRSSDGDVYVSELVTEGSAGSLALATLYRYPLPEGTNDFFELDGEIWLSNHAQGLSRYQGLAAAAEGFPFAAAADLGGLRPEGTASQLVAHHEKENDRLWLETGEYLEVAERDSEGRFHRRRVASDQIGYWCDIHYDTELGRYWLTNSSGSFLWDPDHRRLGPPRRTYLREVLRLRDRSEIRGESQGDARAPALPFAENALRFEFAAPVFDQLGTSEFQYRLEGFDEGWSDWSSETTKEYINLKEGPYRFRVRSRDRWNHLAREATFAFEIRPPIYRTTWAYGLYALAFVGIILVALRLQRRSLARSLERERAISERLREVDRLKDEFLAKTSHELRTPLHGITGLAESLIDGAAGEPSTEMQSNLSMIVASGQRLGHLVNDILDFSKLRHGSLELDRRPVDLRALVEVVLALSRPLVGQRPIELHNAIPEDLPPADGDENRLQQILFNLVGNALKFTESGRVTVAAEREGERLRVEVRDTGIGIAPERQEQIFEAFEQADSTLERQFGGTGLGLAVTRHLVELHGGRLGVESEVGRGSTFGFDLAMASSAGEEPGIEETERARIDPQRARGSAPVPIFEQSDPRRGRPSEATAERARILIVDDEPVNLQILSNYFHGEGFALTSASSGPEALAHLDARSFDLVLLDVMMPMMSGYEVCKRIRETHPVESLPVIFLSAMNRSEERIAGLDHGGNDFLSKPVARGELVSRVELHLALLDTHRRQEEEVHSLRGLLPICMSCKKIRDDEGYWNQMEVYISERTEADFSHGICPPCAEKVMRDLEAATAEESDP